MFLRLLALAGAPVELAEAAVALGDEGDLREPTTGASATESPAYSFGGTVLR